jgi:leucine dehydrogenase
MSFVNAFDLARELGHEELLFFQDRDSGLCAVIAIHDTSLGPAAGGTRMRPYRSLDAAAVEALRLSRAMTYKAALAGVDRGGGKAVIVGDEGEGKSHALLAAYARILDRLGGRFHTGPDMGFHGRDVAELARLSRHVSHAPRDAKVETPDLTALGVLESMRSVARILGREPSGLHVAVQGLGEVGSRLCRLLHAEGARLTVADVDAARTERVVAETGAQVVAPEAIYDVDADVFSPNAAGGVLRDDTVSRLRCAAVVGAANEQLLEDRHGDTLHARGILYAPDYVVNAGGLLSLFFELGQTDEEGIVRRVRSIGPRLAELLARARQEGVAPHRLADRLAEERLAEARQARRSV